MRVAHQPAADLASSRGAKRPWRSRGIFPAASDNDADAIDDARSEMIETLNSFRLALEELGAGLGVTDAVSGSVVLTL